MKVKRLLIIKGMLIVFIIAISAIPFTTAGEAIQLEKYLKNIKEKMLKKETSQRIISTQEDLSPYRIMQKMITAMYATNAIRSHVEMWFQHYYFHVKTDFSYLMYNLQDYKTDGRVSFSTLVPQAGFSTSDWVQAYFVRGLPFYWDYKKRKWKKETLSFFEDEDMLEYTFVSSLFSINEGSMLSDKIELVGVEKKNDKDCFVISYPVDPEVFEREGLMGDMQQKIWIDKQTFLPVASRGEGRIGGAYLLVITDYTEFDVPFPLAVDSFIYTKVEKEKQQLRSRVKGLVEKVAKIRNWAHDGELNFGFITKRSFRDVVKEVVEEDYADKTNTEYEELIFKWLGLVYEDLDYKESIINSTASGIAGLYYPERKMMYVGDWLPSEIAELVFAHEIGHAFQDKMMDLDRFMSEVEDDFDASYVRRALIEGEATAIMLEYLLNKKDKSFRDLEDVFSLIEDRLFKHSEYVKKNIIYNIYGYGTRFVQVYLELHPWSDLGRMYKDLPDSMEQVMHPFRKYLIKEEASQQAGDLEIDFSDEWQEVYRNKLGEYLIFLSLLGGVATEKAKEASQGWGEDRIYVYKDKEGNRTVVLYARWDSDQDSQEFFDAYKEYIYRRFPRIIEDTSNECLILQTEKGNKFFINRQDAYVFVLWTDTLKEKDFKGLVNNIYSQLKSNT